MANGSLDNLPRPADRTDPADRVAETAPRIRVLGHLRLIDQRDDQAVDPERLLVDLLRHDGLDVEHLLRVAAAARVEVHGVFEGQADEVRDRVLRVLGEVGGAASLGLLRGWRAG